MIDELKVLDIKNKISENVEYFTNMIDVIVDENTQSMDKILCEICDNVVNIDNPSTEVVEKYFLELTNCLYFMQERVEKLSIYDSLSKISYKEEHLEVKIPEHMIEQCRTLHFAFRTSFIFCILHKGEKIHFIFPEEICVTLPVEKRMEMTLL